MLYLQVAPFTFHKQINYETSILEHVAYSCCKQNKDMNEMNDAHAYEMQCKYESQTPEVLQSTTIIFSQYSHKVRLFCLFVISQTRDDLLFYISNTNHART
jgi:hypothetical protein